MVKKLKNNFLRLIIGKKLNCRVYFFSEYFDDSTFYFQYPHNFNIYFSFETNCILLLFSKLEKLLKTVKLMKIKC